MNPCPDDHLLRCILRSEANADPSLSPSAFGGGEAPSQDDPELTQ
jgi:hypothetical protein